MINQQNIDDYSKEGSQTSLQDFLETEEHTYSNRDKGYCIQKIIEIHQNPLLQNKGKTLSLYTNKSPFEVISEIKLSPSSESSSEKSYGSGQEMHMPVRISQEKNQLFLNILKQKQDGNQTLTQGFAQPQKLALNPQKKMSSSQDFRKAKVDEVLVIKHSKKIEKDILWIDSDHVGEEEGKMETNENVAIGREANKNVSQDETQENLIQHNPLVLRKTLKNQTHDHNKRERKDSLQNRQIKNRLKTIKDQKTSPFIVQASFNPTTSIKKIRQNSLSQLPRAVSTDNMNQTLGFKKRRKMLKNKDHTTTPVMNRRGKKILGRMRSNLNSSRDSLGDAGGKDYNSQQSLDSNQSERKSCLVKGEERKSSRKLILNGSRVRFDCGDYSEVEEEAKFKENKRKYKKNGQGPPDIKIIIQMKRIVKEISIKANDPLILNPYNKYYLSEKIEQKKYYNDIEVCRIHSQRYKKNSFYHRKDLKQLQLLFAKNVRSQQEMACQNFKDLSQLKSAIKMNDKKTIVFDLENTLLVAMYRKNQIQEYDDSTYVKLFGHSSYKLYLNYRPFMKEMLQQLKQDFELILFGSHNSKYVEKIAATLQKDEQYFDYIISKDMLYHDKDLDFLILDLGILKGQRDLKDIIIVSNSCGKHMLHSSNGVPVREYQGSKKDLSFYSLSKYLKTFKDVKDVRTKICEDFGIQ